ncbi:MAG: nucleoside triphosphate pyrophosphohydrolase [Alphaproteobacteria bacterium]
MTTLPASSHDALLGLPADPMERLLAVMARLRDPDGGCPWDLKQDFSSIAKHTLEEAYEVVDAIEKGDFEGLKEELGDLLLQIVFYAQMAREEGRFDFAAIAQGIADKLVRRHPHVFGDETIATAEAMTERWEQDKAKERAAKQTDGAPPSVLDGVMMALPALSRTQKIVQRATRAGFDWEKAEDVFPKLEEEITELKAEIPSGDRDRLVDELGDVLFTVVCLANKLKIDPETALRGANRKFERRFRGMEAVLSIKNLQTTPISLQEWEQAWIKVKNQE